MPVNQAAVEETPAASRLVRDTLKAELARELSARPGGDAGFSDLASPIAGFSDTLTAIDAFSDGPPQVAGFSDGPPAIAGS
jgi:hypothetical protein